MTMPVQNDSFNPNRRRLLAAPLIAGAAMAVPALAVAADMSREARIQHHAEALLALIRGEFPAAATSLSVTASMNLGPAEHLRRASAVRAHATADVWRANDRLRSGGIWSEESLGSWSPADGHY